MSVHGNRHRDRINAAGAAASGTHLASSGACGLGPLVHTPPLDLDASATWTATSLPATPDPAACTVRSFRSVLVTRARTADQPRLSDCDALVARTASVDCGRAGGLAVPVLEAGPGTPPPLWPVTVAGRTWPLECPLDANVRGAIGMMFLEKGVAPFCSVEKDFKKRTF